MKLSHIAIAAPNLSDISARLKVLSLEVEHVHEVASERVRAAMVPVEISSHFRIELLEPTSTDSPIAKFLEKKPSGGIHHVCFEVSNLSAWPEVLKKAGMEVLAPGIRRSARGEALFIHPKSFSGVLVELEQIHSHP